MSRGYEKNEPREVVVKLRLTASEANVLSSIAERAERPITKVVLSAITTTCIVSVLNKAAWKLGHDGISSIRDEFAKLYFNTTDKEQKANYELLLRLVMSLEDTALKYTRDCEDWLEMEVKKPFQDQLPLNL
jgi:hypothetical protein